MGKEIGGFNISMHQCVCLAAYDLQQPTSYSLPSKKSSPQLCVAHTGTTGFIVGLLRAAVDGLSIYACPTKLLRDAMYRKCGSQAKVVVGQSLAGGDCLAEVAEELLRQQNPEKARAVEWFERCLEDPDRRDCCEQVCSHF